MGSSIMRLTGMGAFCPPRPGRPHAPPGAFVCTLTHLVQCIRKCSSHATRHGLPRTAFALHSSTFQLSIDLLQPIRPCRASTGSLGSANSSSRASARLNWQRLAATPGSPAWRLPQRPTARLLCSSQPFAGSAQPASRSAVSANQMSGQTCTANQSGSHSSAETMLTAPRSQQQQTSRLPRMCCRVCRGNSSPT